MSTIGAQGAIWDAVRRKIDEYTGLGADGGPGNGQPRSPTPQPAPPPGSAASATTSAATPTPPPSGLSLSSLMVPGRAAAAPETPTPPPGPPGIVDKARAFFQPHPSTLEAGKQWSNILGVNKMAQDPGAEFGTTGKVLTTMLSQVPGMALLPNTATTREGRAVVRGAMAGLLEEGIPGQLSPGNIALLLLGSGVKTLGTMSGVLAREATMLQRLLVRGRALKRPVGELQDLTDRLHMARRALGANEFWRRFGVGVDTATNAAFATEGLAAIKEGIEKKDIRMVAQGVFQSAGGAAGTLSGAQRIGKVRPRGPVVGNKPASGIGPVRPSEVRGLMKPSELAPGYEGASFTRTAVEEGEAPRTATTPRSNTPKVRDLDTVQDDIDALEAAYHAKGRRPANFVRALPEDAETLQGVGYEPMPDDLRALYDERDEMLRSAYQPAAYQQEGAGGAPAAAVGPDGQPVLTSQEPAPQQLPLGVQPTGGVSTEPGRQLLQPGGPLDLPPGAPTPPPAGVEPGILTGTSQPPQQRPLGVSPTAGVVEGPRNLLQPEGPLTSVPRETPPETTGAPTPPPRPLSQWRPGDPVTLRDDFTGQPLPPPPNGNGNGGGPTPPPAAPGAGPPTTPTPPHPAGSPRAALIHDYARYSLNEARESAMTQDRPGKYAGTGSGDRQEGTWIHAPYRGTVMEGQDFTLKEATATLDAIDKGKDLTAKQAYIRDKLYQAAEAHPEITEQLDAFDTAETPPPRGVGEGLETPSAESTAPKTPRHQAAADVFFDTAETLGVPLGDVRLTFRPAGTTAAGGERGGYYKGREQYGQPEVVIELPEVGELGASHTASLLQNTIVHELAHHTSGLPHNENVQHPPAFYKEVERLDTLLTNSGRRQELVNRLKQALGEEEGLAKMEVAPGKVAGIASPRLIRELATNLYKGSIPEVIVKETLQNAIDAIPKGKTGKVKVDVDTVDKRITVEDDGIGMLPEVAKREFVDPGLSYKPEGDRGGYGMAKVAILGNAETIHVETVAVDPTTGKKVMTIIEGKGEQAFDQNNPMDVATHTVPDSTPTGTKVSYTLPENINTYSMDRYLRQFQDRSRLPHNLEFTMNGSRIEGAGTSTYIGNKRVELVVERTPVTTLTDRAGDVDVYASKIREEKSYIEVEVLNNGLPQFQMEVSLGQPTKVPSRLVMDVKAKVSPDDAAYPFTPSREELRGPLRTLIQKYVDEDIVAASSAAELKMYSDALKTGPRIKGTRHRMVDSSGGPAAPVLKEIAENRAYSGPLANEVGKVFNAVSEELAELFGNPAYRTHDFGGLSFNPGWYGINLPGSRVGVLGKNVSLINPWMAVATARKLLKVDTAVSLAGDPLPHPDLPKRVAQKLFGTIVHEITHQTSRGHSTEFAGELSFNLPFVIESGQKFIRRLANVLAEGTNLNDLTNDYRGLHDAFELGAGEDVFGSVGTSLGERGSGVRPGGAPGGRQAGPGSRGNLPGGRGGAQGGDAAGDYPVPPPRGVGGI